ncbi:hypothetical protein ACFVZH_22345 [Streptomyces sp. NPDC059534]|uniref:hypothetical protein n=1 Tax=Streptomyces sp. NPDC059534 TaxID=3346859 RepID=UPI003690FE76
MSSTFEELESAYLSTLKRLTAAYDTLHRVMGPVAPLTAGAVPVLTREQIDAHKEAMAAQEEYDAARDAYWAARTV